MIIKFIKKLLGIDLYSLGFMAGKRELIKDLRRFCDKHDLK